LADPDRPAAGAPKPELWLVDGFNLLHAAVLRGRERREWWRGPARERVIALARCFDDPEAEVVVVFDGQKPPDEPLVEEGRVRVVFADSADEWLVKAVRQAPDPGRVVVVTADRQVAARARHRGAGVMGPREFAARCRAAGPEPSGLEPSTDAAPMGPGSVRSRPDHERDR
jgi:predicted RNA-binding protein with PIN domain